MKKLSLILVALVALMATSCHDPEYVEPTANRASITSFTAVITSGAFTGEVLAKLDVTDDNAERFVLPVPYYFPWDSDDQTVELMKRVRISAELGKNCIIEPALTEIDLTEENWFTFTNAYGVSRRICITGERVLPDKCELLGFSIVEPAISGIINQDTKVVSLITGDDLSEALAEVQISAHATISPDPSKIALNYNEPVELTVIAANGVDKTTYVVKKDVPEKIPYGVNSKFDHLFNFNPVAYLGLPDYSNYAAPTLAAIGGNLVICMGNGTAPIATNRLTGALVGEIELGGINPDAITNDDSENMLLINHVNGGETINLWRTKSIKTAPTLYHSFTNPTTLPAGAKVKVNGNLDGEALIVIPIEGIAGVSTANQVIILQVSGGSVVGNQLVTLPISWSDAPVGTAGICSVSNNPADGLFHSQYDGDSNFKWYKADGSLGCSLADDNTGWGLNPNCLDSKVFNNAQYAALFVVSHFPHWGMGPQLALLDVTDRTKLTCDADIWDCPALVLAKEPQWYQDADAGYASGDVVIAPSADGFKLYVYYYDHNSGVVGGYVADCIKK